MAETRDDWDSLLTDEKKEFIRNVRTTSRINLRTLPPEEVKNRVRMIKAMLEEAFAERE